MTEEDCKRALADAVLDAQQVRDELEGISRRLRQQEERSIEWEKVAKTAQKRAGDFEGQVGWLSKRLAEKEAEAGRLRGQIEPPWLLAVRKITIAAALAGGLSVFLAFVVWGTVRAAVLITAELPGISPFTAIMILSIFAIVLYLSSRFR